MESERAAKRRLRVEIEARRDALTDAQRGAASQEIVAHLLAMPEYAAASRVAAYVALPGEVSLTGLLEGVLASGRVLLLPRVEGRRLVFVPARDLRRLGQGPHGLREPSGEADVAPCAGDLVLAPGVAFDRRGGRLGRGAGFYDRSLPRGPEAPLVFGVAFEIQMVERVPLEPHDRHMDGVVTEMGVSRVLPRDPSVDPG